MMPIADADADADAHCPRPLPTPHHRGEHAMNTPTIGALLAQDPVDRYRSFGAFGKPAYQSHVQMRAMLRTQRGLRVANYFAKPTYDPDSGVLRWTSEVPGPARAWHDMTPEEQAQHAPDKVLIHGELVGLIKELREKGGGAEQGGAAAFANLLEQAMKVPADDRFTYFVGDQPMIAFWGFSDASGASVVASAQPTPGAAARPLDASLDAPITPPLLAPPPLPQAKKRPWWWWLLWLLLALLLLALLFFLLPRACTPTVPSGVLPPDGAASMADPARRADEPTLPGPVLPGQGTAPGGSASAVDPALPAASQPGAEPPPVDTPRDDKIEPPPLPKDQSKDPPKDDPKDDPNKPPADTKAQTDPPKPPLVDPKAMRLPEPGKDQRH